MDEVIEEFSILVEMMKNKVNTKTIEKRIIDYIKYLEKTNKERILEEPEMNNNVSSIKKRNDILQTQILDADRVINDLYKQIDELNIEKQELKKVNISLLNDKQNLEKFYEKKEKQTKEKSTGTDLVSLSLSKEQELKNKIKALEKDIANFDQKILDYDQYFDEFEKYHYKISYPLPKSYKTLDEEIQYINFNEKKRYCCFL